jgi:hypothetical protein
MAASGVGCIDLSRGRHHSKIDLPRERHNPFPRCENGHSKGTAMRRMRWLRIGTLVSATALFAALHLTWIRIPPNFAPWGDVMLDHEPGWLARMQVNSLASDPAMCRAALDRSALIYKAVKVRPIIDGCGLEGAVHPIRSHIAYSRPFDLTCGMMAALYWYEAELQQRAEAELGRQIARIDHLGTYACRNINGAAQGRRSQHATANAIDIAAFHLADGRTISVLRDWGKETPEGRFLIGAREDACRFFNVVLSPRYNAAHANHFHVDLGGFRMCN